MHEDIRIFSISVYTYCLRILCPYTQEGTPIYTRVGLPPMARRGGAEGEREEDMNSPAAKRLCTSAVSGLRRIAVEGNIGECMEIGFL